MQSESDYGETGRGETDNIDERRVCRANVSERERGVGETANIDGRNNG